MRNAIILHGMPSKEEYESEQTGPQSQGHWIPWLKQKLETKGIEVVTPDLPKPYEPDYFAWKEVFEQFPVTEETILVGHSCGAGFLARWLSENIRKVGKVVLVAPWMDPAPNVLHTSFFDFTLDPEVPSRTESLDIFWSADDDEDILGTVEILETAWPDAHTRRFADKGHFTLSDMKTREFPELAELLI